MNPDTHVTDVTFNPEGDRRIDYIKRAGIELEHAIRNNTSPGRRQALALTNLETALMFAVNAAAVGDPQ